MPFLPHFDASKEECSCERSFRAFGDAIRASRSTILVLTPKPAITTCGDSPTALYGPEAIVLTGICYSVAIRPDRCANAVASTRFATPVFSKMWLT